MFDDLIDDVIGGAVEGLVEGLVEAEILSSVFSRNRFDRISDYDDDYLDRPVRKMNPVLAEKIERENLRMHPAVGFRHDYGNDGIESNRSCSHIQNYKPEKTEEEKSRDERKRLLWILGSVSALMVIVPIVMLIWKLS